MVSWVSRMASPAAVTSGRLMPVSSAARATRALSITRCMASSWDRRFTAMLRVSTGRRRSASSSCGLTAMPGAAMV